MCANSQVAKLQTSQLMDWSTWMLKQAIIYKLTSL